MQICLKGVRIRQVLFLECFTKMMHFPHMQMWFKMSICPFQLVMTNLQSNLENVDTPELLCQSVKCILQVAHCYPHVFSINFRVSLLLYTFLFCICWLMTPQLFLRHVIFFTGYSGYIGGLAHRPHSEAVSHTASFRSFEFSFSLVNPLFGGIILIFLFHF